MKYLYFVAIFAAFGNAAAAYDGSINSTVIGWGVAALMFVAAFLRELSDNT